MTGAASLLLAAALLAVGLLHLLRAAGVHWPAVYGEDLARKAIPDADEIPPRLTVLLVGAAYVALAAHREGPRSAPDPLDGNAARGRTGRPTPQWTRPGATLL
jgi:hypothetical protein